MVFQRRKTAILKFTTVGDYAEIPDTIAPLPYHYFNHDFYASERYYEEVQEICERHKERLIDLRPYMIETPFIVQSTDKLQKILDIFRFMQLRAIGVTNPETGALEGIITRQNIFAYIHL